MKSLKISSGIQKKYLKYTIALLLLALLLSSAGVWGYMRLTLTRSLVEKYEFVDERMGLELDNLYRKTDEVTGECILDDTVQKSIRKSGLTEVEKNTLSKHFAYIDLDYVADYCYVDNRGNIYTRSYKEVSRRTFAESGFEDCLGDAYAKTQWFWAKDSLFGTDEPALFIGRYVRSLEYAHEPGMLFLKMDAAFLERVMAEVAETSEDGITAVMSPDGEICLGEEDPQKEIPKEVGEMLKAEGRSKTSGMIFSGRKAAEGILSAYRQKESGFIVFTYVPNSVFHRQMRQIFIVMVLIYLFVIVLAINLSIYFSRRFTKPIQDISQAMTGFDGTDFTHRIELHTNTELDQIGHSYNEMLGNIEQLLWEVKAQQKELRTSELNMLISQINPHFLYNTLDTIYMLARISKEETTMKMIQALSKYLRLSLSKGREIVSVEDELENVRNYMEIQQIRNENLFHYEIQCEVDETQTQVLKLILQPLVENAIKYGFCDIFEGGIIRITVTEDEAFLVFTVFNNGTLMEADTVRSLNALSEKAISQMKESFPEKGSGYGVVNIMTRLRLKYGENVVFYYKVSEEGTSCVIKIPKGGWEDEKR